MGKKKVVKKKVKKSRIELEVAANRPDARLRVHVAHQRGVAPDPADLAELAAAAKKAREQKDGGSIVEEEEEEG